MRVASSASASIAGLLNPACMASMDGKLKVNIW